MKNILYGFILSLFLIQSAFAAVPYTAVDGTVAFAADFNSNMDYFENKFSTIGGHNHDGVNSRHITTVGLTWNGNAIALNYGGTGISSFASGDMMYATSDGTLAKLAQGALGSIMTYGFTKAEPEWIAPAATKDLVLVSGGSEKNPQWKGLALPTGAVFFMLTGDCPYGSTDITATYAGKFLMTNTTQGVTGGSLTIAEANLPAHTHATGTLDTTNTTPALQYASGGIGGGATYFTASPNYNGTTNVGGEPGWASDGNTALLRAAPHKHTLSGSVANTGSGTDYTQPFVGCKLCQVQ